MNLPSTLHAETARQALDQAGIIRLSVTSIDDVILGLHELNGRWELIGWAPGTCDLITDLAATTSEVAGGLFLRAPADEGTAVELRRRLDWLCPVPVGMRASIGLGDRLGIATPGHVRALREHPGLFPVLAQQSARELQRTGRRFADVHTHATFGAMASGWRHGFGADADHLKSMGEVTEALAAGFTTITADPIHLVPDMSADAPASEIRQAFGRQIGMRWRTTNDRSAAGTERMWTRTGTNHPDRRCPDRGSCPVRAGHPVPHPGMAAPGLRVGGGPRSHSRLPSTRSGIRRRPSIMSTS